MSISIETAFNELGIDAITGTQMLEWLNVNQVDLSDPSRFHRLREVIEYFKQFPPDTQRFLIVRATNGKLIQDKLQHVWEYTNLLSTRKSYEDMGNLIERERSVLGENPDPTAKASVDMRSLENREKLGKINEEINLYEK